MIEVILLAVLAAVTYLVASDGPHGAAITFVSVVVSGLVAMNFFEPLAQFLTSNVLGSYDWQHRWDVIALLGLFAGGVFGLRALGEKLLPTYAELHSMVYEIARWGFALATGYVTMAILLTSLHVAPLPREFLGFEPERNNFFQFAAPDRQWLGFTQYVSEKSLQRTVNGAKVIFDGPEYPRIPMEPETNQVWSSFPIKYAARREAFETGAGTATPAATPPGGAAPGGPAAPTPRPGGTSPGF